MDQDSESLYRHAQGSDQVKPHLLVLSHPIQGHVAPLLKFSHLVADHGVKVTFFNTDFVIARILAEFKDLKEHDRVRLASFPDGLQSDDDRKDPTKMGEDVHKRMPRHLQEFMKTNQLDPDNRITYVVADVAVGWALMMAKEMGLKRAAFWPGSPGGLALAYQVPKFVEAGVLDMEGNLLRNEKVELSASLPPMDCTDFPWKHSGELKPDVLFQFMFAVKSMTDLSDFVLCNWFHELDPSADQLIPNLLSVGPLLADGKPAANFWSEDSACLNWLDKQRARSVVYIAFGSSTQFSQLQFDELAHAFELARRPFLWVVRTNLVKTSSIKYPDGFLERVAEYGEIVEWAPQEMVLAHPSVTCFFTHCGWNSIMEGLSKGVPFLCWPFFTDQQSNRTCVRDAWKTGLSVSPDHNGIVSRQEIRDKLEELLLNDTIKDNSSMMKDLAKKSFGGEGTSLKNLVHFIGKIR